MESAKPEEIRSFLLHIKILLESEDNYVFRTDLPKNKNTLLKLGFTPEQALQEIIDLTYKDYCSGPEPNRSKDGRHEGNVWKFGKKVCDLEVYIKFHLISHKRFSKVVIISFHEPEFPLTYPYK